MRTTTLLLALLAACDGASGGADAAVDLVGGGPVEMTMPDLTPAVPPTLCTSTACAASPCTPGCTYARPGGTSCAATVATNVVQACPGFCGLFVDVSYPGSAFGCWYYDAADPSCDTCGYHGECFKSHESGVDYQFGGAVCASGEACGNGGPLDDAGIPCDMTPVDGGTPG